MKEKDALQVEKEATLITAEPGDASELMAQVRAEFQKYLDKREAVRKSLGKLRRTTLLEKILS